MKVNFLFLSLAISSGVNTKISIGKKMCVILCESEQPSSREVHRYFLLKESPNHFLHWPFRAHRNQTEESAEAGKFQRFSELLFLFDEL